MIASRKSNLEDKIMLRKYSIKDLEHLTGIKAHTLRIWEQRYDIIEPKRTQTNIRYYHEEDLKHLLNISVLINSGIKISKVACLSKGEIQQTVIEESEYKGNFEAQINTLKVAMLEYDTNLFKKVLSASIEKVGSDETFTKLVGAFIYQVGILWQTNAISLSHEHFASNLIKQKLYVAIDQVEPKLNTDPKTYLLYLPDEELHEVGLLYLQYCLKSAGNEVIYLGQSVPAHYLVDVIEKRGVDSLISIFTTNPHVDLMPTYLQKLFSLTKGKNLEYRFCGYQLTHYEHPDKQEQLYIYSTLKELKDGLF